VPLFEPRNSSGSNPKVKVDEKRIEEACRQLHGQDEQKVRACVVERTERLKRF